MTNPSKSPQYVQGELLIVRHAWHVVVDATPIRRGRLAGTWAVVLAPIHRDPSSVGYAVTVRGVTPGVESDSIRAPWVVFDVDRPSPEDVQKAVEAFWATSDRVQARRVETRAKAQTALADREIAPGMVVDVKYRDCTRAELVREVNPRTGKIGIASAGHASGIRWIPATLVRGIVPADSADAVRVQQYAAPVRPMPRRVSPRTLRSLGLI